MFVVFFFICFSVFSVVFVPGYTFYWAEDASISANIRSVAYAKVTSQYVADMCNADGACMAFAIVSYYGGAYFLKNGNLTLFNMSLNTRFNSSSIYGTYIKGIDDYIHTLP